MAGLSNTLLLHGMPLPPADIQAMLQLGSQGGDLQVWNLSDWLAESP